MSEKRPEYIAGRPKTIFRVIKNANNPYVMMDKRPLKNPALSWKAKGILAYLLSCPDGWEVNIVDLVNRATDGTASVRSGLNELREIGHCRYAPTRDEQHHIAKWVIEVHEVPIPPPVGGEEIDTTASNDLDDEIRNVGQVLDGENLLIGNRTQVIKNLSNIKCGGKAPSIFRDPLWDIQHGKDPQALSSEEVSRREMASALELLAPTPHLQILARAFIEATNIHPTVTGTKAWMKSLQELYDNRITPQDLKEAVKRMRHDELTIADPFSVKKVAIDVRAKNRTRPAAQEKPAYVERLESGNFVKPSQILNKDLRERLTGHAT